MRTTAQPIAEPPGKTAVVSKALLRSSELLGLTAKELSTIVGLSEPSISRLKRSVTAVHLPARATNSHCFSSASTARSMQLSAVMMLVARQWIRTDNTMLGGKPLNRIKTIDGLAHVLAYLDARRAPI